jgi:uncharacterized membrane protein YadS
MKIIFYVALALHTIAFLGILGLLISQAAKSPRKLSKGVIHAAWAALVAGLVMVGLYSEVKPDEELNHTIIGIKTIVLSTILLLSYLNVKKSELKSWVWGTMIALTAFNIIIAVGG